jgi:flagellar basal-body rod protein FlgG
MERGLYIAAAGMLSEMVRQDQIANDLANAATSGYKADKAVQRSFAEVMLDNARSGQPIGTLGRGPFIARQVTDWSQGDLKSTDEPLDLAIVGDGFFAVRSAQGVRYTRNGQFQAAPDGTLIDQLGNHVLGRNNQPVKIAANGTVDPTQIGVFKLNNPKKAGDSYVNGQAAGPDRGIVRTGVLEGSGVDAGRTMVDMIASLRAYQASQKTITTIDDTLRLASSQVGTLPG